MRREVGLEEPNIREIQEAVEREGLYVIQVGPRVVLDVLVSDDGSVMTFIRIDGELLAELEVKGVA